MRLGEKIGDLRRSKKIEIDELSKLTGIPKSTLADYEAAEDGKISNLLKIAQALQVPIGELVDENFVQINHANENIQIQFNISINAKDSNDVEEIIKAIKPIIK